MDVVREEEAETESDPCVASSATRDLSLRRHHALVSQNNSVEEKVTVGDVTKNVTTLSVDHGESSGGEDYEGESGEGEPFLRRENQGVILAVVERIVVECFVTF